MIGWAAGYETSFIDYSFNSILIVSINISIYIYLSIYQYLCQNVSKACLLLWHAYKFAMIHCLHYSIYLGVNCSACEIME